MNHFIQKNLDIVRKCLFSYHYPQDLIGKHIKIRIDQVKSRKGSNVEMDIKNEAFDEHNTIVFPYFGQILKTIHFILKKFKNHTIVRIPIRMETLNYHNFLSDHRKEYADHDFDRNNVEILHFESNKGKREFMEMLYIKREGGYSIKGLAGFFM